MTIIFNNLFVNNLQINFTLVNFSVFIVFFVLFARRPFTTFIASPYCLSLMVKASLAGSSRARYLSLHPHFSIIIFYRLEIKEMTTLFWNFELLQLISAAKIRYNRQNNTTKKIRVDPYYNHSFSCFLWSIISESFYNTLVLNTLQNNFTLVNFS
jgi:hypothetical protein